MQKQQQSAFTLLEMLLVIVIIGIMASFALLAVGDFGHKRRLQRAVEQLQTRIALAETQALLEATPWAVKFNQHSYAFYRWHKKQEEKKAQWELIRQDNVFAPHALPDNAVFVSITKPTAGMSTVLSADYLIAPFQVAIADNAGEIQWQITGEANGEININESTL